MKGKLTEIAGELTDNPVLEAEGTDEKIAGEINILGGYGATNNPVETTGPFSMTAWLSAPALVFISPKIVAAKSAVVDFYPKSSR